MNLRIKIAEFSASTHFTCKQGKVVGSEKAYHLPEMFEALVSISENLTYGFRLFHLHTASQAETIHLNLPVGLRKQVDIVPAGDRLEGRGIPRFWIVKTGFKYKSDIVAFLGEIAETLPLELYRKIQIEGGEFPIYPHIPTSEVILRSPQGEIIAQDKILRLSAPAGMVIQQVPVGETFHWEHSEDLTFNNILELRPGEKGLLVINESPLEEYLASVNSSEMSAYAPLEFLKAQSIAARGTVLATKGCHHYGEPFDLCNGDHCQCYYGKSRLQPRSLEAVETTSGQVLTYQSIICDTRYAKICGGITETFDNVWENFNPPYLPRKFDSESKCGVDSLQSTPMFSYIQSSPACYCNPFLHPYPDYLSEACKWFRWEIKYSGEELSKIVNERISSGIGQILSLQPEAWGLSGRIKRMRIKGAKGESELNGELRIRRALSYSHLPSSCFIIEQEDEIITLKGAGWGHGVGLCQMGALNMALMGKKCEEILQHYYPGTKCESMKAIK